MIERVVFWAVVLSPRLLFQLFLLTGLLWAVGAIPVQCGGQTVVFRSDPQFLYENVHQLPGIMRGRITLAAPGLGGGESPLAGPSEEPGTGEPARPLDGLRVTVMAEAQDGTIAVRKLAEVSVAGTFEVFGLPEGKATVIVQLGGGAEVWRVDDVLCGRGVPVDPRLDPIQLGALLHWFDLRFFDESGAPARAGHLVWRESLSSGDAVNAFAGDAVIEGGRAVFAATAPCLDLVPLVPGAATELFEGLYGGEEVHLGPGVSALFEATGPLPDPSEWRVRFSLRPIAPQPAIDYTEGGLEISGIGAPLVAELRNGVELALARGGTYELAWWIMPWDAKREVTMRFEAPNVEVPADPGRHRVVVEFPMEAFLEREAAAR